FGRQRDQRPPGPREFAQFVQVAWTRLHDPIGPVDAWAPRADVGALQVQSEDPVPAADRAGRCDSGPPLRARIRDQRGETGRRAIAPVRLGDGAHAVRRRSIVEKNAVAPIDLQVYKARRKESTGRQAYVRPIMGNLAPGTKSSDAAVANQHRGVGVPAVTIKNAVRQYGVPCGDCRIVSARAHRCPWQTGLVAQQIQSKLKTTEDPVHRTQRRSWCEQTQSRCPLFAHRASGYGKRTAWTDWSFAAAGALKARSRFAGRRTRPCRRLPLRFSAPDGWSWGMSRK